MMMDTYYSGTPESQDSCAEELQKLPVEAIRQSGGFAKATIADRTSEGADTLGTPARSTGTFSACPSVYNPSTLTPYKPKGRSARKPIRHLKPDQTLSTPQLLKFKPLRDWDHLRPNERLALIAQTVLLSEAMAFSLNLRTDFEQKLRKAKGGAVTILSNKMRRQLERCFDIVPELSFALEFDDDGRLHVHGIAILQDWSKQTTAKFRQALKQAGGVIHGFAGAKQVELKPLYSDYWRTYMTMDFERTIDLLGTDKITYASHSMSRLAREAHEAERARLKAAKTKTKAKSKPATNAEPATGTHTASPTPSPAPTQPKHADESPRPSLAVPAYKGLSAALIAEVEALLDGL